MIEDSTLQRLIRAVPMLADRPASDWHVTRLAGMTNRSWRLTAGDRDLVLRAPGVSSERYLSRAQELHNAGLAAEIGIAPPLLYADPETGVTLQPFLADARALGPGDLAEPEVARKVGALLGRLHRSSCRFAGIMAPFPIIDVYLGLAADERLRALRRRMEPIRAALELSVPPAVPSHIDANPANFLLLPDGSLKLIDWEFSAMCEPAWDLASVVIEGAMSAEAISALHEGYGRAPDISRLWLMRTALHLVAGSWTYAEIAGGNTAAGLPELLEDRLTRLERNLDDPELAEHLRQAG